MVLAQILKDQEEELVNILRIGAANGEKKISIDLCVYAFNRSIRRNRLNTRK
jgi:hypothetical protein